MKRLTTEQCIQRAKQVHGDRYDYSKVEYKNNMTHICVICRKHDEFWVRPDHFWDGLGCPQCFKENIEKQKKETAEKYLIAANSKYGGKFDYSKVICNDIEEMQTIICPIHGEYRQTLCSHLDSIHGCPKCYRESRKRLHNGVGKTDLLNVNNEKSYPVWLSMMQRCYNPKAQIKYPSYKGCSMCDEWLLYSNFKKWYDENYVEGYHIDKDIIKKGNRVYCPEYCCFVPNEINVLFTKNYKNRGKYPKGVNESSKTKGRFETSVGGKYIGTFDTPEEAFNAYKQEKERQIKEKATDYYNRGLIDKRVRDAMFRYEVEITD